MDGASGRIAEDPWTKYETIEGWFRRSNFVVWRWFNQFQHAAGIKGDLAEIGVWRGRSAAVLASFLSDKERLVLCDPKLIQVGALENIKALGANTSAVEAQPCLSYAMTVAPRSVRWFHVDGAHDKAGVYDDIAVADRALADQGVICLDDFFNARWAGITIAAVQYLDRHPNLKLLLVGDNKAYLCRPAAFGAYREAILDGLPATFAAEAPEWAIHQSASLFDCEALGLSWVWKQGEHVVGFDEYGGDAARIERLKTVRY